LSVRRRDNGRKLLKASTGEDLTINVLNFAKHVFIFPGRVFYPLKRDYSFLTIVFDYATRVRKISTIDSNYE
jgi:hypothetical protein